MAQIPWILVFMILSNNSLLTCGADENPSFVPEDGTAKFPDPKKEEKANIKLPQCAACTTLVGSFQKGLERTSRGKLEGGDTAWEEKKQGGGYANSEVRLVEIQEHLCRDVVRGEHQCHHYHQEWEELLETWWRIQAEERPDLHHWLCVERLKLCCPPDHFGSKCSRCSQVGFNGKICSGNGKCKGAGTRKGNGLCSCEKGYTGETCDHCSTGFFESYRDNNKVLCSPCHDACLGPCTGSGMKSCLSCKAGYTFVPEEGCVDVDECEVSSNSSAPCPTEKFCVNTPGSFDCITCDKACKGCNGEGPDACLECSEGYAMDKDNVCVSQDSTAKPGSITEEL